MKNGTFVPASLEFFAEKVEITFAFGDQGALFEKTAPWTPAKTFY